MRPNARNSKTRPSHGRFIDLSLEIVKLLLQLQVLCQSPRTGWTLESNALRQRWRTGGGQTSADVKATFGLAVRV